MDKEWLNWKYFDADIEQLSIKKIKGVYVFVAKEKFEFDLEYFNSEVTGKFCIDGKTMMVTVSVPPCNKKESKFTVNQGDVFYVGSADDIKGRVNYHLNCREINNTVALKLGFNTRKYVKRKLKIYYYETEEKKKLEKSIRKKYDVIFGR